jgi:hypothetical protein
MKGALILANDPGFFCSLKKDLKLLHGNCAERDNSIKLMTEDPRVYLMAEDRIDGWNDTDIPLEAISTDIVTPSWLRAAVRKCSVMLLER